MVEQARDNNKEISFSEDSSRSATGWYALFQDALVPLTVQAKKSVIS